MNNIYYELAQTQLALDAAQKVIHRQRGQAFRQEPTAGRHHWSVLDCLQDAGREREEVQGRKGTRRCCRSRNRRDAV